MPAESEFEISLAKAAKRALTRMPANDRGTILAKIRAVAADPDTPNNNVRPLRGAPGFRLRVGDWRVLYLLDRETRQMAIRDILPRGDAYR